MQYSWQYFLSSNRKPTSCRSFEEWTNQRSIIQQKFCLNLQRKYIIGQRIIYYGQRFNIRSPFVLFLTLILFFCSFFIFLMRLSEKSFFFILLFLYVLSSTDSNPEANNFFQHFCSEILSPSSTKRLCTPFPDFPCNCGLDIFFFCRLFASSNVNICVHLS